MPLRFTVLILALLIVFSGCGYLPGSDAYEGRQMLEGFSPHFRTDASFKLDDMQVTAQIEALSPERVTIALISPEALMGFSYSIRQDGVDVAYLDLGFSVLSAGAARASPLTQVASALSGMLIPSRENLPIRGEEFWELAGNTSGGDALLFIDDETALPAKLSLDDGTFIIILENFAFLG